ncbi:MAG: hypothetical protein WCO65_02980 [bacterium]
MKLSKTFVFIFSIIITSALYQPMVSAATIPLPNVQIYAKSASTSRFINSTTDIHGSFVFVNVEDSGFYNLFVNDESMPPITLQAHKGVLSGRVVVLTDGTTTQDPPKPITKSKTIFKKVSDPIKKIISATSTKNKI